MSFYSFCQGSQKCENEVQELSAPWCDFPDSISNISFKPPAKEL